MSGRVRAVADVNAPDPGVPIWEPADSGHGAAHLPLRLEVVEVAVDRGDGLPEKSSGIAAGST